MKIYFDKSNTLHVAPEDTTELMALKYWVKEYREHGAKVLAVDIEEGESLKVDK